MSTNNVGVSLLSFGEKYHQVYKSGGTIKDLMVAVGMTNINSVRQKIVILKKNFPNLPSLKRQGRSANNGETVGNQVMAKLSELFAELNESQTEQTETQTEEMETTV